MLDLPLLGLVLGAVAVGVAVVAVLLLNKRWPRWVFGVRPLEAPNLESCTTLALQYLETQRLMEALVVCKKGIKAAPDDPAGYVLLARVFMAQSKWHRAAVPLRQALVIRPGHEEASRLLAEIESRGTKRRR
jgi:cytochrome c-type biogenesis protein CcmH/NrfG